MDIDRHIRRKFRIKGESAFPLCGWLDSSREHLSELFCELGYKIGAEIGVQRGVHAEELCQKIPDLKLFCIDPWVPYSRISQRMQDRNFRWTQARLVKYNVQYIKKKSQDALSDIPDSSLDFVYIDGLHDFDNTMLDLIGWSKKVRPGGIVSGHDFLYNQHWKVIQAVQGYVMGHGISPWYVTKDYTGPPSFFWVKT